VGSCKDSTVAIECREGLIRRFDKNVYEQHISDILEKQPRFEFISLFG
jgi:hypothetical protein